MKKMNALVLSALLLAASLLPALAAETPSLLAVLEIRGLDNLAGSAFELSKAAGQPTPKEALSLLMYGALGTMPGMGIAADGTVRMLWLANGTEQGGAALLLPVAADGPDYLSGLVDAGWTNASAEPVGIQHYIAPEGAGLAWNDVYFLRAGATIVAAETEEDVRKADAAMPGLPAILPAEGDVALQVRPAALMELFAPQIQEQMDKAFQASPAAPPEAAAMGELYARGYVAVAKQLDAFTLGLGVANGNLNVHAHVAPVAETTLAKWLATVQAPAEATAVVNLPGALFAETIHLGDVNLIGPAYFQYLEELMALMPPQPGADSMKAYMDNAKTYWAQMSGDVGIALLPPTRENPLRIAEYIALKDAAALRPLVQKMLQDANEMMKTMSSDTNMPVPFKLEVIPGEPRAHREIPVDTAAYVLTPGAIIADQWPAGMPTKLDIEMAWVPGGVLVSVGDAALTDQLVDRALDGVQAPISDMAPWKAAYPNPDPNPVDTSHLALFDTLRAYLGLVDSFTGGNTAGYIPSGAGNVESVSYMARGGLMSRVRFSLSDIAAIGQKIQEAQERPWPR